MVKPTVLKLLLRTFYESQSWSCNFGTVLEKMAAKIEFRNQDFWWIVPTPKASLSSKREPTRCRVRSSYHVHGSKRQFNELTRPGASHFDQSILKTSHSRGPHPMGKKGSWDMGKSAWDTPLKCNRMGNRLNFSLGTFSLMAIAYDTVSTTLLSLIESNIRLI